MSSGNNNFPSSWSEGNALRLKKYYMEQTACATNYFDAGKIVYYVKADGPTSTWVCIWENDKNAASDPPHLACVYTKMLERAAEFGDRNVHNVANFNMRFKHDRTARRIPPTPPPNSTSSWTEGNALRLKQYVWEQTACATNYFDAGKIVYYVKADGPTSTWVCIWENDKNAASDPPHLACVYTEMLERATEFADRNVHNEANFNMKSRHAGVS